MKETNYISHLNAFFTNVYEDTRLNPTHISLYMALFQFWNQHRFASTFSVSRSDVMTLSRIRSKTTYSKCLGDLDQWRYLTYDRSHNPLAKSRFSLTNVWSADWPIIVSDLESTSPVNGPVLDKSVPKNGLVLDESVPVNGPVVDESVPKNGPPLVPLYKTYKHKLRNVEAPPDKKMVIDFFKTQEANSDEALKFWNHYQAIGWKSGNTKIENWQAAATKWLIGNKQRTASGLVQKMDHLRTTKNKDYGKPL